MRHCERSKAISERRLLWPFGPRNDNRIIITSVHILVFFTMLFATPTFAEDWAELKGDHFIIYYQADNRFASEVLRKSESYYRNIGKDLSFTRYSNFWQWENRVKIYIFPNKEQYQGATNEPAWSEGVASYTKKEIRSYAWSKGFLDALLPHEITHLVFRDFVGFKGEVPLWLDEGVAQWEEPAKRAVVRKTMKAQLTAGKFFPVTQMTTVNLEQMKGDEVVAFYVQAASFVDFLITEYGSEGFIVFCRQLRDGKSLDDALRFAYPTSIRNQKDLEEKWNNYILSTPS